MIFSVPICQRSSFYENFFIPTERKEGTDMALMIDGNHLTIEDVIQVARHGEKVELTEEAKAKVNKARAYVDQKLEDGAVIYGLTTGFGKFSDVLISADETKELQRNLIISHSCAMGEPLSEEISRAVMLLRCNALSKGNSGIRLSTIQTCLLYTSRCV